MNPEQSDQPVAEVQPSTSGDTEMSSHPTLPPQVEEEQPHQDEAGIARGNDSFDATVAIVPRSQQLTRNTIRPIAYNEVADTITTPLQKFQDYVIKYINVIGQVVSVFRTVKGSVVIRIWDGTAHRFTHNTQLFLAEDTWIEEYFSQPMIQFEDLPKDYVADIVVYGEFIQIAENLRSGDMIHMANLHLYRQKSQRQITPSIHENGKAYNRHIVLLDEEEQIIVDKKSLLVDKLEYVKGNPKMSRMAGFFNRPSAQVRPLQQSPRARPIPGESASVGKLLPEFNATRQILKERAASVPKESAAAGGQKRTAIDNEVEPLQQPSKKLPRLMPFAANKAPAPTLPSTSRTDPAPPSPPEVCNAAAVPTVQQQHEKAPVSLPQRPKKGPKINLEAFFRDRLPANYQAEYAPSFAAAMRTHGCIFDFLNRKPTLVDCSAQTSPQASPVKKSSKAVQVNVERVKPVTRNSSVQKSPVKTRNANCGTNSVETRAAQTSPVKYPAKASTMSAVCSLPVTSPYRSVYKRIKKETDGNSLLKSPPRAPARADSLIRDASPRRATKRIASKQEDSRPPVPPHRKKLKTDSPQKSVNRQLQVDPIEIKPRFHPQPQQNIFAKPKYPAIRSEVEQKPNIHSSPAQKLQIRPVRESSVSTRTRSAKKPVVDARTFSDESEPDRKPVRPPVINRSLLEPERQPIWSQHVHANTRRGCSTRSAKDTPDIKSER